MAITRLKKKHKKNVIKIKERKKRLKQLLSRPVIKYQASSA